MTERRKDSPSPNVDERQSHERIDSTIEASRSSIESEAPSLESANTVSAGGSLRGVRALRCIPSPRPDMSMDHMVYQIGNLL
jgi:hypothetical protein